MWLWWGLSGCSSNITPDDSSDDTAASDCEGELSVQVEGEAVPGGVLSLSVPGAESVIWSVSGGTLDAPDALSASWSLPVEVAINGPEDLVVTAEAQGCTLESHEATVTLDWSEADRVVVLFNPAVEGSEDVARYYADFRAIPEDRLCGISTEADTTLPGEDLEDWIASLTGCLESAGPQVMYLVPVFGTPYKISGRIALSPDYSTTTVSLDALAVLYEIATTTDYAIYSPLYRDGDSTTQTYDPYLPIGELRAEIRELYDLDVLLVTRIDGESAEAAMDLVDRTQLAEGLAGDGGLSGTVYVDGRYGDEEPADDSFGSYNSGEWNMWGTRYLFESLDWYPVVWDGNSEEFGTEPAPTWCEDALYYAGWYSYYNYNDAFEWTTGAIGGHLDSCSACDIRSAGTWSGSALQQGITATFGAVAEPYVAGMPEYDQFFTYLTQGASFAEAGYESTTLGFWMMTWIGDPLYRPYPAMRTW